MVQRCSFRHITPSAAATGAQRNSRRCTSARAPFGSETRDTRDKRYMDHELETSFCGRGTPGPVYGFQQSVGRQVLSTKTTGGRATMGKAARFGGGRVDGHTPDLQTGTSAIGRQTHSARATLPSYGFGTSTRDGAKAVRPCRLAWYVADQDLSGVAHAKASHSNSARSQPDSNRARELNLRPPTFLASCHGQAPRCCT